MPLHTDASEDEATEVATDLRTELGLGEGARDGVSTHLIGQGALWAALQELSKEDLAKAESAGFPLVLLILLAVFGSLAAAALPLALGFVSVLVTGALIFAISQVFQMSVFVTNMASMIGIGVAVDYSLFVLARYREEVAAGRSPEDARATALATSGVAVLFSGLTVIISLAGLWMVDNNALRSMALGAMLVVAVSMLGSATLLPVLIRVLGHRAHTPGRVVGRIAARLRRPASRPRSDGGFWERWTEAVMRRPVLAVIGASLILLTLAAPALGLRMASGALEGLPADDDTRIGFEAASALAGPGASSPVLVMVTPRDGDADASEAAAGRVTAAMERDPGIATVAPPIASRNGQALLVRAQPGMNPESQEAKALVTRLRETLPGASGPEVSVDVGGVTAAQVDIADLISGSMWKILVFLLGLSYIVLLILLRSVVLPAKAVLMNVLSVGAAYGVLTLVYEEVESLVPPLVLAVVFGLSMDYEVFLLSRIRERYAVTGDTRRAVAEGLAASARTITSAALIMVAVFGAFIAVGVPSIQQIGLGTAVAIALDATLVRLVLVPAAMELMGRWNWYLPGTLARILPRTAFDEAAPSPGTSIPSPASS
jgi:RND superfamily putative drug exporter